MPERRTLDVTTGDTVSIAIAMFNGARFLPEQLDSIAAQTRLPDELIVTDDASGDDSAAIVERFAERVTFPVRLIRHPCNIGILENFHSAFAATTGSVIFYCDQDDVWRPDKIATILAALRPPTMLAMHQSEIVDEDLTSHGRIEPGNARYGRVAFPANTGSIHGYGHQMAFRRPVLDLMRQLRPRVDSIDPGGFAHDLDRFIPFCAGLLGDLMLMADPLVRFRRHASATSPAGTTIVPSAIRTPRGWRDKARHVVTVDTSRSALALAIVHEAIKDQLIPASIAPRLRKAFTLRAARLQRQTKARARGGVVVGMETMAAIIAELPKRGRFSNDRPLRAAALSLIIACTSRRHIFPRGEPQIEASPDNIGNA